ncbi:MAG TPA: DNA translocase FtsK 4TM domain-containing protein [Candidatus Saccharimonadales bacterium]|nr:DNA translocase FtsK 4TM domain-containing protein [Candidatus Saccharimonadales bacterium]
MAKKRKPGRPRGAKKKTELKKPSSNFWRGFGAVVLIILGIVLLFGAFIGAPVPHDLWNGFWWAIGAASVIAPITLIYLGGLKFASEDQRTPFHKILGIAALWLFLASWLYTAFLHTDAATGLLIGGHGGVVGEAVGKAVEGALGRFLSSLIFFILAVFALLFTFSVEPKTLLKLFSALKPKAEAGEEESASEDLADLKKKASGFQLHEGVPVEHHVPSRMTSLRNTAQKLTPEQDHAALTVASDPDWQFPPLNLLNDKQDKADAGNVAANAETIKSTFENFNINVEVEGANVGPRVTQYTIKPPTGVKLSKLTALEDNLKLDLAANSIRMEAPIPGKRSVGVEVPNVKAATVTVHGLIASEQWRELKSPLGFTIGKDIAGTPVVGNLDSMPHLLIAGQTGSGKSVMINTLLTSLLYRNSPADLKLILVDPKQVEMALYHDIPHLLSPVITEPEKCISALKWAVAEMDRRLKAFAEVGKRNIGEYNSLKKEEGMPYIVVVIDELADLMMMAARDVETLIVRLAQKARAAGIHLVIATQRPSVDVITGLIKANVPARIAFTVVSQVDSRTIIDQVGAEKLLGRGDLLFSIPELPKPKRVQGAFISDTETTKVCDFLRGQRPPSYDDEVVSQPVQLNGRGGVVAGTDGGDMDDDMWKDAVRVVIDSRKASTSLLQRKLRIGYGRASRLMDMMEEQGIIGSADGAKPRDVLVNSLDEVFAEREPAGVAPAGEGDVYDDMPD